MGVPQRFRVVAVQVRFQHDVVALGHDQAVHGIAAKEGHQIDVIFQSVFVEGPGRR